jgi:RNA polymerase sigma-70 factor (ECF subfamily)
MDAEDLTEDVFIKVWQRLPEYREQGVPFIAFLMRVAHNVLIDFYRSFSRTTTEALAEESLLQDPESDPGDQVQANLEHLEVKHLLDQLREDYRIVLAARFLSGLSPVETARVMNKSEGAIRVLQHRALEALRKLLSASSTRKDEDEQPA